ncbi:MAG: tRNA uridine(34) 5-carboxymethylaminomethyl modification radical SAM/GNAT enzyme Elp3, partial [Candidatus Pacebacteria bacterium]|nr:tRNA uridine(34) 5-carboxymethylaminomethyl modification radical SAM/GNAT enzyme Elp3 [Candidatus Paceibacterota bacterium]
MHTNEEIIKELFLKKDPTSNDLSCIKRKISKKYKTPCPSNVSLLKVYHNLIKSKTYKEDPVIENLLKIRPIRSLSGVINVSVLTKSFSCPGKCTFCPKEKDIPKSYLSGEPAVERAKRLKYDPYIQVQKRVELLESTGHNAEKIDLRVIGGTWSAYNSKYQIWFIKKCFDACNQKEYKKEPYYKKTVKKLFEELIEAQRINESAKYRIIGISFETRPDFITTKEVLEMRKLGATKIEIGVQSIYDDVLKKTKRGHDVKTTIKATELLKNAGFKVSYQIMLNLPKSDLKRDLDMFKELFKKEEFKPDYLKIYPCALLKNSDLYKDYKKGTYKPYTSEELIDLIKDIKKEVPYYTRIERIIRDIPAPLIVEGGAKTSNLRQIIDAQIKKEGWSCKCIRCREIRDRKQDLNIKMFRENYFAQSGNEIFLSFEDEKRKNLYSMLRLRIHDKTAFIREVHTYGESKKISQAGSVQHRGLGKALIAEAEKITKKEYGIKKLSVISGVGVRDYYRKQGYELENFYMVKYL